MKTYRNKKLRLISWISGLGFFGAFLYLAIAPTPAIDDGFSRALSVLLAFGSLFAYWRAAEMSVQVDSVGLVIRNFNGTHRVRWEQIEEFSLPRWAHWANVRLVDGKIVSLHGIQPARAAWLFGRRSVAADHVDELNALLEERRSLPFPSLSGQSKKAARERGGRTPQ